MQSLKKLVADGLIVLELLLGIIMSASAVNDIESLETRAEQGHQWAQAALGANYSLGTADFPQDYRKAFYWHSKSAEQGNAKSQYILGSTYFIGQGVRQDYGKSVYWYSKSANQNYVEAQFQLGMLYSFSGGVGIDEVQAKEWFGKACDNGNQAGCNGYKGLNQKGY